MSLLGDAQVEAAAEALYGKTFSMYSPHRIAKEMLEASLPLIETQLREHALEVLVAHEPTYWTHGNGQPVGCSCMDRVFVKGREDWPSHVADVLAARVVRGTTNQESSET